MGRPEITGASDSDRWVGTWLGPLGPASGEIGAFEIGDSSPPKNLKDIGLKYVDDFRRTYALEVFFRG